MSILDGLLDKDGTPLHKGKSPEVSGVQNQPGVYEHPETGARIITAPGSKGVPQADALVRQGWERKGPVPSPKEIADMQKKVRDETLAAEAAEKAAEASKPAAGGKGDAGTAALKRQLKEAEDRAKAAEERATKAEANAEEALKLADEVSKNANANTGDGDGKPAAGGNAEGGDPKNSNSNMDEENK